MLEFGNKEFRNLQEQVGKNQEDIKALKTGIKVSYWVNAVTDLPPFLTEEHYGQYIVVGSGDNQKLYVITKRSNDGWLALNLGNYPLKGETGDAGEQGIQGIVGPKGTGIYGVSHILPNPDDYQLGDFFLLDTGAVYKDVTNYQGNKSWVLQCSLKGPQGIQGEDGDEVQANPSGSATAYLTKIGIDGVIYDLPSALTEDDRAMLDNLEEYVEFDADGSVTFGHDITADGNLVAHNDVEVGRNLYVDDITKIQDPDGNQIAQGKLTAGTNITIENNVISASGGGSLPTTPTTDGDYVLQRAVASGASSDSWVENGMIVRYEGNIPQIFPQTIKDDLSNGKIVFLKGNWSTFNNVLFLPERTGEGRYGMFFGFSGVAPVMGHYDFQGYNIFLDFKGSIPGHQPQHYFISTINHKELPVYPIANPSPQCLSIGANGGNLSWADYGKTTLYKHHLVYSTGMLSIISTYPNAYSTSFKPTEDTTSNIKVSITRRVSPNNYAAFYMENTSSGFRISSIDSTNTISHYSFNDADFVSDTVEEL